MFSIENFRNKKFINIFFCFQYKTLFGYCPQVDALNSYMTAYEILKYMAWIRGTPRHRIHKEVEKWLKRMDLTRYKHVTIQCYSGGTKRKLNTAIAMVCFCSKFLYCRNFLLENGMKIILMVVFLDRCTAINIA